MNTLMSTDLLFTGLRYVISLLFGLYITFQISDILHTYKTRLYAAIFTVLSLFVQCIGYVLLGEEMGLKLYPVFLHLPLAVFLIVCCKIKWSIAITSVLSAYLCCQVPNWASRTFLLLFDGFTYVAMIEFFIYTICVVVFLYVFQRYFLEPFRDVLQISTRTILAFATFPLIYYLFDYATTVYTELLYRGGWHVAQFMPTIVCLMYLIFVFSYQKEYQKRAQSQMDRELLEAQMRQAQIHLTALQQSQQEMANFRHDLRHHIILLQGYLQENHPDKAIQYLNDASDRINAFTPTRYCTNDAVNLICSYFVEQTRQKDISLQLSIQLPSTLPLGDAELCAILSNSLENAIHAVMPLPKDQRNITLTLRTHQNKLLFSCFLKTVGKR